MNKSVKKICIFASATNDLKEIYYKDVIRLGELIGKNGYDVVYGGSRLGLMYACINSARENGSDVFGVMPQKFVDMGLNNSQDCREFYITKGMRERKAKLDELSDAVVAVAGGFGTLEELSEMIVQKQLGYNNKPIVMLNTEHFYDKLLDFMEYLISENFARPISKDIYYVAKTPEDAIEYINNYVAGKSVEKLARF